MNEREALALAVAVGVLHATRRKYRAARKAVVGTWTGRYQEYKAGAEMKEYKAAQDVYKTACEAVKAARHALKKAIHAIEEEK